MDIDKKENTNNTSFIPELSITSTDCEDQTLAKLKKNLKPKSKSSVSDSYAENIPLAKKKQ